MRVLLLHTYYPECLRDLYRADPSLDHCDFAEQRRRVLDASICLGDAYSHELRNLGCMAEDIIVNADRMQVRWAQQNNVTRSGNIHDQRRQIVAAQIDVLRPDVLYVFEWCPLGDDFLEQVKPKVRLVVGQMASSLPARRTYRAYDLMISSWPPIVEYFRREGKPAELIRLAFDRRILDRFSHPRAWQRCAERQHDTRGTEEPSAPSVAHDVTFVGGFAPAHAHRAQWLESLLQELHIDVFGYALDNVPATSPIHAHHRGHTWGRRMYEVLASSRITLNCHARIDVRGRAVNHLANNMRLFEATGVGTCLVTEAADNLDDLFEAGKEVVIYEDANDCAAKVKHYLQHEKERRAIAQAGQDRTLRQHTYAHRMAELVELLRRRL